ncbi:MAG TPA: hypothetical protein VMJ34_05235 [Bryobacteraceae bacterium]|nr:hypothetical protein [Bryobacteraceae bacterium]
MKCEYCENRLGAWRVFTGSRFCSKDHERRFLARSARALRDLEDIYGTQSLTHDLPEVQVHRKKPELETRRAQPGQVITVLGLFTAGFLVLALFALPGGGPAPARRTAPDYTPHGTPRADFALGLRNRLSSSTPSLTLRDNFSTDLSNWVGGSESTSTWARSGDYVLPGKLRLWKPSTHLSNYELEFLGQIERRGMSWAFRAPDIRNYYGAKLLIGHPGPMPNASLVRFVVLNGREAERLELPVPLTLDRNTDYRVHVSVRGDRFLTSVNGQLVSSWMDERLGTGGVGFFAEAGEKSAIRWVSVSERDSMLGRFLSYFSIITFPTAPPATAPAM